MSSLASAPLLSNFDEPIRTRHSTRDSPLLFETLHEDGMTVKKLGAQLKTCSVIFLIASPLYPAAVSLWFFTLNWFLIAFALMVGQALLGSTGFRVAKKRKIRRVGKFLWWLKVFVGAAGVSIVSYQVSGMWASLRVVACKERRLAEVCVERGGWEVKHLLLACLLPISDLFIAVFLLHVWKVATRFERALINDLMGLNAAWED